MKKTIITIVSLLLASSIMFASMATALAEDEPKYYIYDGYIYEYMDTTSVRILAYIGDRTTINIPESIQGAKVRSIGPLAFYGVSAGEISIPRTVEEIGDEAFFNSKVRHLTLSARTAKIGYGVFRDCVKLESVVFKDDHASIPYSSLGEYMFYGCTSLEDIDLPYRIVRIPTGCFSYCTSLRHVENIVNVEYVDSNAFYASGLEYIVFDSRVEIGSKAFAYCRNLGHASTFNWPRYVSDDAFLGCDELLDFEVNIPPSGGSYIPPSEYPSGVIPPEENLNPGNPCATQDEYEPGYNFSYGDSYGDVPEGENDVIDNASDKVENMQKYLAPLAHNADPIGDADLDNKVTIKDATQIQKIAADLISKNTPRYNEMEKYGDVDTDGNVTVLDATKVQKYLANIIKSLY